MKSTVTKVALGVLAALIALIVLLPGNPSNSASAPQKDAKDAAQPSVATSTAPAGASLDCDRVSDQARQMIAERDRGMTEDAALTALRERGDFRLSFVVDAVFHGPADTPAAITVSDVVATCRRVSETGTAY
jgi:hypothetical protein